MKAFHQPVVLGVICGRVESSRPKQVEKLGINPFGEHRSYWDEKIMLKCLPTIPVAGSPSSSSGGHGAQRGSPPGCRQRCCQQCSYTTQCPSKLKRHQRIHTGERPFQCSHCGKAFIEKGNLVTHLRVHTGERPFLCHLCPSAFTQVNALVGHVRSHTGERPFHCRFCPEAFKHRPQKKAHEQKAHNHHQ
ncbi:uncharacterized protein LOC144179901 [Haemaphysalis longicornis]